MSELVWADSWAEASSADKKVWGHRVEEASCVRDPKGQSWS